MRHVIFASLFAILFCIQASGLTIHVPGDFPRIQDGIDAAVDGDSILVAEGVYTGIGNRDLYIPWKRIYIISESGPESTVIDCEYLSDGVTFYSDGEALLEGFTVRQGIHGLICNGGENAVVRRCIFSENNAGSGGSFGGGIQNWGSLPILDCKISNNYASFGGGICWFSFLNPQIIYGCEITNNLAEWRGGAIYYHDGNEWSNRMEVTACTIYGNSAGETGSVAYVNSVSYSFASPFLVLNSCIVKENSDPYFDFAFGGSVEVNYTNFETGWPGLGNINEDPLFLDPLNGDFRLHASSPCIDIGDPELPPRVGGGRSRIDMGAHEYQYGFDYDVGTLHTVRRVPADYPTIQAAIDASAPYDTILVAPGTYTGEGNVNIEIPGRSLTLVSEAGPDATIIDCEYASNVRGLRYESINHYIPQTVQGFTIQNSSRYGIFNKADLILEDCRITGCVIEESGYPIYTASEELIISRCVISNNVGGSYGVAGVRFNMRDDSYYLIVNSLITSNTGSSIFCNSDQLDITNCTIADNTEGYGVVLIDKSIDVNITNCILWNNAHGQIFVDDSVPDPSICYSDIMGGWEGEGNIDADPLFLDPENGDFHLTLGSPCIDTGTSAGAPELRLKTLFDGQVW